MARTSGFAKPKVLDGIVPTGPNYAGTVIEIGTV
jgi:hypothetical protein